MLSTRLQSYYTVEDLVEELGEWIEDGYVDTAVWKRLQNHVSGDVLPTFSKRARLHEASQSSEPLPLNGESTRRAGAAGCSATHEVEAISPTTTGKKIFLFMFDVSTNIHLNIC